MLQAPASMPPRRIAVLIDGDNAQPGLIENVLAETAKYGLVTIRRIYGDWTEANMKGWKETLHHHALQPIQQFRYTTGKNATDMALIIDAMDILYEGVVNGFCLVSSDSDYTGLAKRVREKGLFVMGIGRKNTPRPFVNACEAFVYTENLIAETGRSTTLAQAPTAGDLSESPPDPLPILKRAVGMALQESGWASLATVGNMLRQLDPSFDSRSYGRRQLSQLVNDYPGEFEVREERFPSGASQIYVRPNE